MQKQNKDQYRTLILGGTGACGRVLIEELKKNNKIKEIVLPVRRILDQWKENKTKLKIIEGNNLRELLNEDYVYNEIDVVICCLGSRVNRGSKEFQEIDYDLPVLAGQKCIKHNIKQYIIITSVGTNPTSIFEYLRVKGKTEESLKKMEIDQLTILKPGAIIDRDNDSRCGEKILKYLPFIDKIYPIDIAKAIIHIADAYFFQFQQFPKVLILDNKEIKANADQQSIQIK